MKNFFTSPAAVGIGTAVILLTAIVLSVTKFKVPPQSLGLDSYSATNNSKAMPTYTNPGVLPADQITNQRVRMETSKGVIVFTLDAAAAPKAVSNFVYLAKAGYYDGLLFHRVDPGFVIQGGDPNTRSSDRDLWGRGDPGYKFEDEKVTQDYTAGTVAMANAGPNTNGSQFFIMLEDRPDLPKQYTIFGHVTEGLDVVRSIAIGDAMTKVTVEPAS